MNAITTLFYTNNAIEKTAANTIIVTNMQCATAGLEIISGESLDTMTGQIHFSSVTYRFWPVKLYKINNS